MSSTPENTRAGNGGVVPPPEHRWKPGVSPNPGGRPKTKRLHAAIRRVGRLPLKRLREIDPEKLTVDAATAVKVRRELYNSKRVPVRLLHEVLLVEGLGPDDDATRGDLRGLTINVNFSPEGTRVELERELPRELPSNGNGNGQPHELAAGEEEE